MSVDKNYHWEGDKTFVLLIEKIYVCIGIRVVIKQTASQENAEQSMLSLQLFFLRKNWEFICLWIVSVIKYLCILHAKFAVWWLSTLQSLNCCYFVDTTPLQVSLSTHVQLYNNQWLESLLLCLQFWDLKLKPPACKASSLPLSNTSNCEE